MFYLQVAVRVSSRLTFTLAWQSFCRTHSSFLPHSFTSLEDPKITGINNLGLISLQNLLTFKSILFALFSLLCKNFGNIHSNFSFNYLIILMLHFYFFQNVKLLSGIWEQLVNGNICDSSLIH